MNSTNITTTMTTNMTTNMLDNMINEKLSCLNENNLYATVDVMALIDQRYNIEDTTEQFNSRLRTLVKKNFNKDFLTDDMKNTFREWETKLENLSNMATRYDIFALASQQALIIIGM